MAPSEDGLAGVAISVGHCKMRDEGIDDSLIKGLIIRVTERNGRKKEGICDDVGRVLLSEAHCLHTAWEQVIDICYGKLEGAGMCEFPAWGSAHGYKF